MKQSCFQVFITQPSIHSSPFLYHFSSTRELAGVFTRVANTACFSRVQTSSRRCFCAQCQQGGFHLITRLLHINRNLKSSRPSAVPSWLEGVSAQATPNEPDWKEGTVVLGCCSAVIKNTKMLPCTHQTTLSPKNPRGPWFARRLMGASGYFWKAPVANGPPFILTAPSLGVFWSEISVITAASALPANGGFKGLIFHGEMQI